MTMVAAAVFEDLHMTHGDKHLSFTIRDVNVAVVNALRRCILSRVPSVAFPYDPTITPPRLPDSGILIRKNTSPTHNEMLGHRLSLVPVCVNERQLEEWEPERYLFSLHAKNESAETQLVTSKDIKVRDAKTGKEAPKELRDQWFPASPVTGDHVLLTKLNPSVYEDGQGGEVDLEAVATVGTEAQHARWCPVSVCYFVNVVDPKAADAAFEAMDPQKRPSKQQFDVLGALRHFHKNEYGEPNVFRFFLESECGLGAPYLVRQGLHELQRRVAAVREALETRDVDKVVVAKTADVAAAKNDPYTKARTTARSRLVTESADRVTSTVSTDGKEEEEDTTMFNVIVSGEDHTCGNLVQALLYEKNLRHDDDSDRSSTTTTTATSKQRRLVYVGYHQPHPLEDCIVIRLGFRVGRGGDGDSSIDVAAFLLGQLASIEDDLREYATAWKRATASSTS